jgi:hypothetical protein
MANKTNKMKLESQEVWVGDNPIDKMLLKLPVVFDWWDYKGERVFVGINYEATKKARKPMMNIYYCATRALNDVVLKTVQYDKNKFSPPKT